MGSMNMRVAVVHSFYRSDQPSGENVAVLQQVDALRNAGIEILEVFRSTDEESEAPLYKMRSAISVATGVDFGHPQRAISEFAPDLVHVHNTFPNFGTRWLTKLEIPIVTTLHNFRASCANGLLYRDGHICLECPTSGSKAAFVHGCYQGSRAASLPAAISTAGGAKGNRLLKASAAIITQSARVHSFMIQQGIPEARLHLIPGFVEERHTQVTEPPTIPRFIFVGRNTPEKGLAELLQLWPTELQLDVVGSNEMVSALQQGKNNVRNLGVRQRAWIAEQLPTYTALVFPGRVWEGAYPLVVREALEAGIPVVALADSGAADLITDFDVGAIYEDGSESHLRNALEAIIEGGQQLRLRAREVFKQKLTEDVWVAHVRAVYGQALASTVRS
jgi:glycosyltransferase involved in cell wall biosynthesis